MPKRLKREETSQWFKHLAKAIAESRGIEVGEDSILLTFKQLGYNPLELAELTIRLESNLNIYVADPHAWTNISDTLYIASNKLKQVYEKHQIRYPKGKC